MMKHIIVFLLCMLAGIANAQTSVVKTTHTKAVKTDVVYVPIWCAQWAHSCDWPGAAMWQFTDRLKVGNRWFDGNWLLE